MSGFDKFVILGYWLSFYLCKIISTHDIVSCSDGLVGTVTDKHKQSVAAAKHIEFLSAQRVDNSATSHPVPAPAPTTHSRVFHTVEVVDTPKSAAQPGPVGETKADNILEKKTAVDKEATEQSGHSENEAAATTSKEDKPEVCIVLYVVVILMM